MRRTKKYLSVLVNVNPDRYVVIDDAPGCRSVCYGTAVQYNTASNKQSPRDGLHMNLLWRPRRYSRAGGTDTRNWLETLGIEPPKSKVIKDWTQQFTTPISWQYFGEQVCEIGRRILLMYLQNPCCRRLTNRMIVNRVVLLTKDRLRDTCILDHALVITVNLCRSFQRDAEHPKFISERDNHISYMTQSDNSLPNVEVSTVFCRWLTHKIGAFWTKTSLPVCERRVTTFPAWFASTKTCIFTG